MGSISQSFVLGFVLSEKHTKQTMRRAHDTSAMYKREVIGGRFLENYYKSVDPS